MKKKTYLISAHLLGKLVKAGKADIIASEPCNVNEVNVIMRTKSNNVTKAALNRLAKSYKRKKSDITNIRFEKVRAI